MKIAVPVHDEKREIFIRVGRAPYFAVYEEGNFKELRPNLHSHEHDHEGGSHHGAHRHGQGGRGRGRGPGGGFGSEHFTTDEEPMDAYSPEEVELHRKDLGNLADVDIMLCRAVGPNMKEALELSGIQVVKIRKKEGELADQIVENYLSRKIV